MISTFYNYFSLLLIDNPLLIVIFTLAIAALFSYTMIPTLVYVSVTKNLMANPNERSSHLKKISNLGGVGIAFGAFFSCAFFGSLLLSDNEMSILLSMTAPLVILFAAGLKDDIVGLSPKIKLFTEVLSALIFISLTDIRIDSFHGIFGIYEFNEILSIAFTVFVFVLIINSYNMIDGINGLAGSIAILILSSFTYFFYVNNILIGLVSTSACLGGVLAFLRFNLSRGKRKIFMGDVGSLVVGFVLAVYATACLSSKFDFSDFFVNKPVYVLALFAYPFIDTLRVFYLRTKAGKSPFKPDRNHLHHKLLDFGYSHVQSTLIILGYCLLVILSAVVFHDSSIHGHLLFTFLTSVVLLLLILRVICKKKMKC
jgi:UDP-N-acetylmuramyl pentapeptide phosphotransferase/UDP-N-acetylglucosamine-1-phosphate transferase